MKRFLAAIALACALSVSALAGDVPTSGFTSPEPAGPTQTTGATSPGEIPSVPGDVPTSGFQQQVSDGALSALLSVLGLLTL
ncbi:MAG: hypothetical protein AABN95_19315 [Acidobacteriota bacterium]